MKAMTCRQIGGPCDTLIQGNTPEELLDNGTQHVMESNDDEHKQVLVMMNDMMNNPEEAKRWNDDFAAKFASLPEI